MIIILYHQAVLSITLIHSLVLQQNIGCKYDPYNKNKIKISFHYDVFIDAGQI